MNKNIIILTILIAMMILLSCDEAFPPRMVPPTVIILKSAFASQGRDMGGFYITFSISGENIYEETLYDTVDLEGKIHVWWKKHPEHRATLELNNNNFTKYTNITAQGILTLDPGETFFLATQWNLITDKGVDIVPLMDYPPELISGNIQKSKPETFKFNVELKIFDEVPKLELKHKEFTFEAWKLKDSGP